MATTEVKKQLETYLPLLSQRQQEILLDVVMNLLNIDKKEKRISVTQYNKEIEASVAQIRKGEIVNHADILKQSKKWLKRK